MGMSYDDSVVLTVDNSFITGDLDESILELHWEHWFLDCVGNHMVFGFYGFVQVFRIVELIKDKDLVFCFQVGVLLQLLDSVDDLSGVALDLELFVLSGVKDNSGL